MLNPSFFRASSLKITVVAVVALFATAYVHAESLPGTVANSTNENTVAYSSSNTGVAEALPSAPEPADPAAAGQYGRRRHEHDRSRGYAREGGTFTFELGLGFNVPTDHNADWNTTGYNLTVGAGRLFNPQFGVLLEYQFLDNGLSSTLTNYYDVNYGTTGANAHTWSFSLDPILYLIPKGKNRVYATGGAGIYHKSTNFTYPSNYNYPSISTDAYKLGINGGAGISHQIGWHDRTSVFAEARYLWVNTGNFPNGQDANSLARTTTIPVTFGIRY